MTFCFMALVSAMAIHITLVSLKVGISPMPTSKKVKEALFNHFPSIESGEVLELGSGWGHLCFPLATQLPACSIKGIEYSWVPYLFSRCMQKIMKRPNLKIEKGDFYQTSFRHAQCVVCYLFPKAMEKLKEKFDKELPEGAFVISHTFAITGWKPITETIASDLYRTKIYLYQT